MTGEDQRRLADEMTTNAERSTIVVDKLVGQIAIETDKLLTEYTKKFYEKEGKIIDKLGGFANEILAEIRTSLQTSLAGGKDVFQEQRIKLVVEPTDLLLGGFRIGKVSAQQAANQK